MWAAFARAMGSKVVRGVGLLAVMAGVAVVGCAAEEGEASIDRPAPGLTIKPNTVLTPLEASDAAIVTEDALLFPKTEANVAWIETVKPGRILAGDHGPDDNNPHGFLRRVKSIEMNDMIVVQTERVGLAEAFEGRIRFGRGQSIFGRKSGGTQIRKVPTTKDSDKSTSRTQVDVGGDNTIEGLSFSLKEPKVDVDAGFNGDLDVAVQTNGWKVWDIKVDVDAFAELYMNLDASVKVELGASVSASKEVSLSLKKPPKIWITSPVTSSIELTPIAKCTIDAKGQTTTSAVLFFKGDLVAGFDYDGSFKPRGVADFHAGVRDEQTNGSIDISGNCTVEIKLALLAFDAVGIEGTLGAEANLKARACAAANGQGANASASVSGDYRVYGHVNAKVQVPLVDKELVNHQLLGKDFFSGTFGKASNAGTQTDGGLVETECVPLTN